MITALAVLWIISTWALLALALAYAATIPLMCRREPDPADDPGQHGMPYEEVTFPSRDGLVLGGWWIPAHDHARGTVIMCAGQNGSMDKDVPQAVPLHHANYNVLMFDFRAHGRSEGNIVTIGALEQADLFGALDYLERERGIARVGVLGFSMGAGVALMVAAQDERIAALVVDGAYPRLAGILTGYMRLRGLPGPPARAFAWLILLAGSLRTHYELFRANPIDLAARITAPTFLIHGDRDPFVSPDDMNALAELINGPVDVWRLGDCGHREAYKNHPDAYNRRVVDWFARYLA